MVINPAFLPIIRQILCVYVSSQLYYDVIILIIIMFLFVLFLCV